MVETVDALELEISTRAGSAAESVESLAASVSDFGKNVRRYVNNLTDFAGALERIADAAKSLSGIKGLGSVLGKIANGNLLAKAATPNVSAAQAVARKVGQDWKHAMFRSKAEYETIFPGRAIFRGRMPEKWVHTDNNSSRVIDANDVVKSQATALARQFQQAFGLDRGFRTGDLASRIMNIRAGMGRFDGANHAWITPQAKEGLEELAHLITMNAHSTRDGDAIERLASLGSKIWLNPMDVGQMKSAGYSIGSLNALLRGTGYSVTTDRNSSALERGKFTEALGLPANASITDLVSELLGAYSARNQAFIGEHSFGGDMSQAEEYVREQIISQILDVGARNEKVEMAPEMKAVADALEAQHKQNLESGAYRNVADEVKGATENITAEVKAATETVVADVKNATGATNKPSGTSFKTGSVFNPVTGTYEKLAEPVGRFVPPPSWKEGYAEEQKAKAEAEKANRQFTRDPFLDAEVKKKGFDAVWQNRAMYGDRLEKQFPEETAAKLAEGARASEEVKDNLEQAAPAMQEVSDGAQSAAPAMNEVSNAAADAAGNAGDLSGAVQETGEKSGVLKGLVDRVKDIGHSMREAVAGSFSLKGALAGIGKMIGHSIIGQLARVAKMRALRYLVRTIVSGFKEGLTNLYQWSDAINGHFAGAMDNLKTKSTLLKNSLATALAPAIEALVPVISRVVSWINTACNAIAQFFALLNGKTTWTKAVETAQKWGSSTAKAAGTAHDAMKDLLADWDELNIIQGQASSGGGGGGGGAAADVGGMFEEMSHFDEWTRYFNEVKDIVASIGKGIAAWFVLGKAQQFLSMLGFAGAKVDSIFAAIREGVVGAVLLKIGFSLASAAGKDIAINGLTVSNILTSVGAMAASAMGGYFVGAAVAKAAAALAGAAIPGAGLVGAIVGLTIAAVIEIEAYITQKEKSAYEKAEAWVKKEAFNFDVDAQLNIMNTTVTDYSDAHSKVQSYFADMHLTADAIRLGIRDDYTMNRFRQQLGDQNSGLIHDLNEEAAKAKNLVRLQYTLVPGEVMYEAGKGGAAGEYAKTAGQWDTVTKWFEQKGQELGRLFVENEKGEIVVSDTELAAAIMQQVDEATRIAEAAMKNAEFNVDLSLSIDDETDPDKIAEAYEDYIKKIQEAGDEQYKNTLLSQETLVAYLEGIYGAETDPRKKAAIGKDLEEAKTKRDELTRPGAREDYISRYTSGARGYGDEKVREKLLEEFQPALDRMVQDLLVNNGISPAEFKKDGAESFLLAYALNTWGQQYGSAAEWLKQNGNLKLDDLLSTNVKELLDEARGVEAPKAPKASPKEVEEAAKARIEAAEAEKEAAEEMQRVTNGSTVGITDAGKPGFLTSPNAYGIRDIAPQPLSDEEMTAKLDELVKAGEESAEAAKEAGESAVDYLESHSDLFTITMPDEGLEIDAMTSGMATDATVGAMSASVGEKMERQSGTMNQMLAVMRQVQTNTLRAANKKMEIRIAPGSLVGAFVERSIGAFSAVTGG